MKSEIIEHLGQSDLLLPALIAEGLAANDRIKVRLSVLQAADRHARGGDGRFELADECRLVGIDAAQSENLVNGATATANQRIAAPGLAALGAAISEDVATMARPVKAADEPQGEQALARLSALEVELAEIESWRASA